MSYTIQQLNVGTIEGLTTTITMNDNVIITASNTLTVNNTTTTAILVEGGIDVGNSIGAGNPSIDVNGTKIINGPTTLGAFPNASDYITRGAVESLVPGSQDLEGVLTIGNTTGNNDIVLSGTGTLTSDTGVVLTIDAGVEDFTISGDNGTVTTTTNLGYTIGGTKTESITGSSSTTAAGIGLTSTSTFTASGTTAEVTANTGALTLTATLGAVNVNVASGGMSIDTGVNTLTVNSGDVALTAPLPSDIAGALNSLQGQITGTTPQRVAYQLSTIEILTLDAYPNIKPIYWNWIQTRYGSGGMGYASPVLIFNVADNAVDIHVYNETGTVDMLATTSFAAGFYAQALSNVPTANARIYVEIRSTTPGSAGTVRGMSLEWTAANTA